MENSSEKNNYLFVADAMLGKIAKKLRIFGFDTIYKSDFDDAEIIDISKKEMRIILTSDRDLFYRCKKIEIDSVLIDKNTEVDNIIKILKSVDIKFINTSNFSSRCTLCNNLLKFTSDKNLIKQKNVIPPFVINTQETFYMCDNCNKIYWNGSHIKHILQRVDEINKKLQESDLYYKQYL